MPFKTSDRDYELHSDKKKSSYYLKCKMIYLLEMVRKISNHAHSQNLFTRL